MHHIFKNFELSYNSAEHDVRRQQLRARALAAGYIGAALRTARRYHRPMHRRHVMASTG